MAPVAQVVFDSPVPENLIRTHFYSGAYTPSDFYCQTCELSLVGDTAVNAAGLNEPYIETNEEEIKYEPEYGND